MKTADDHWEMHARQWQQIGPPLRPCAADMALIEAAVERFQPDHIGARRVLLLGVTPEMVGHRWPVSTEMLAVDSSPAMVRSVWPGSDHFAATAVVGDWKALPLAEASMDVAIADGCFVVMDYPSGYQAVLAAVHKALRRDGLFVVRWFLRPDEPETTDTVFNDLWAGRIGNFHVFKWRLAMSLQADLESGVRLADVWSAWHEAVPDPATLSARLAWPAGEIATIDAYRDAQARYTFPTAEEARAAFSADFAEVLLQMPDYELGERCVHFALRPRD